MLLTIVQQLTHVAVVFMIIVAPTFLFYLLGLAVKRALKK